MHASHGVSAGDEQFGQAGADASGGADLEDLHGCSFSEWWVRTTVRRCE